MATHTLYISATGLIGIKATEHGLDVSGRFVVPASDHTKDGSLEYSDFQKWLRKHEDDQFQIIADFIEEEHQFEELPALRIRDRTLLARKRMESRYRDSKFRTWNQVTSTTKSSSNLLALFQNQSSSICLSALRTDATIAPWVQELEAAHCRVTQLISPSLLAAAMVGNNAKNKTGLLVSLQPAGLRQTLVMAGNVRFTRLARLNEQPTAAALKDEITRTLQYLNMSQIVTREQMSDNFTVWIVQDGFSTDTIQQVSAIEAMNEVSCSWVLPNTGRIPVSGHVEHELASLPAWIKLTNQNWQLRSRKRKFVKSYAPSQLLFAERSSQARKLIWTSSGTVCASILLGIAMFEAQAFNSNAELTKNALVEAKNQNLSLQTRIDAQQSQYQLQGNELWLITELAQALQDRQVDAASLFATIDKAISRTEAITVNKLRWIRGELANNTIAGTTQPVQKAPAVMAPAMLAPALTVPASGLLTQTSSSPNQAIGGAIKKLPSNIQMPLAVEISSSLSSRIDRDSANQIAEGFAKSIARDCGCEVKVTQPPYDKTPASQLTGNFSNGRSDTAVPFVVHIQMKN